MFHSHAKLGLLFPIGLANTQYKIYYLYTKHSFRLDLFGKFLELFFLYGPHSRWTP